MGWFNFLDSWIQQFQISTCSSSSGSETPRDLTVCQRKTLHRLWHQRRPAKENTQKTHLTLQAPALWNPLFCLKCWHKWCSSVSLYHFSKVGKLPQIPDTGLWQAKVSQLGLITQQLYSVSLAEFSQMLQYWKFRWPFVTASWSWRQVIFSWSAWPVSPMKMWDGFTSLWSTRLLCKYASAPKSKLRRWLQNKHCRISTKCQQRATVSICQITGHIIEPSPHQMLFDQLLLPHPTSLANNQLTQNPVENLFNSEVFGRNQGSW